MPRKLERTPVRVTWRIDEADLELLNALFPNKVNTAMRALIHAYCERERAKLHSLGAPPNGL